MKIAQVAASYALGKVSVEDLPELAVKMLEDGEDAPALRVLAASQGGDWQQFSRVFGRALKESGGQMPSRQEAMLYLARIIAKSVLEGELSPPEGARRIWWELSSP